MPVPFRYRKLGYVALNVTDIARTTEFATRTFVLENSGTGPSGEQFLSCGPEHHDVVLYQSKEPGFVRGACLHHLHGSFAHAFEQQNANLVFGLRQMGRRSEIHEGNVFPMAIR